MFTVRSANSGNGEGIKSRHSEGSMEITGGDNSAAIPARNSTTKFFDWLVKNLIQIPKQQKKTTNIITPKLSFTYDNERKKKTTEYRQSPIQL